MNSLSEIIPPDNCIIKSEVQDIEAKARNTGAAGLIPELPLAPGSPLLPGARGLFAGATNKRAEEGRTQICRAQAENKHFFLWHQHCPSRPKLPLELSQLQALVWH